MKSIITLVFLTFTISLFSQEIVTDRPDQTESAVSVPENSLQIEAGAVIERTNAGILINESMTFPGILFRYGMIENFEVRVSTSHKKITLKSLGEKEKFSGMSDIEIGGKYEVTDGAFKSAVLAHAVIPSGNKGFTADEYGFIGLVALSHDVTDNFSLGYNAGYSNYSGMDGNLIYSVAASFGLTEDLGCFLEYYGQYAQMEYDYHNMDAGFTYLIQDNLQLDFSFGSSLDIRSNFYSAGVSWRIDRN